MSVQSHAFPGIAASVPEARHFVVDAVDGLGCPQETCDAAALIVTELAANAVVHALSDFTVAVEPVPLGLEVLVTDESTDPPHLREPTIRGGRGLRLVDALALSWGCREQASGGKSVYARLSC